MLKKYLPPYQASGLIKELKEHDRMRLIQEREARRWRTLSACRSMKDSSLSAKSRDQVSCDTSITSDAHESISRLTSVRKFILLLYYLKGDRILKLYYLCLIYKRNVYQYSLINFSFNYKSLLNK